MIPDKTALERLRSRFPKGARVRLVWMDDVQAPPVGTEGNVISVDSIGTIHIAWDTGSSLGAAYGTEVVERV